MSEPRAVRPGGGATSALLAAAVVIWGTTFWPIDVASEHAPPIMLALLRVAPTLVFFLAVFVLLRRRFPTGRLLAGSLVSGLVINALFQWVLMDSVVRIGPGNSAVMVNTTPLVVAVLGFIFLRERLGALASVGLVIGFVGVVMMVWSQIGDFPNAGTLIGGVALAFAGAAAWGIGALVLRAVTRGRTDTDMIGVSVVQYAIGTVVLLPVAFSVAGTSGTDWSAVGLWVPVLWIGPVTGIALLILFIVLHWMEAARATSVLFLIPAVAIVVEIARGNAPGAVALAGMFIAIVGVGLAAAPRGMLGRSALRVFRPRPS